LQLGFEDALKIKAPDLFQLGVLQFVLANIIVIFNIFINTTSKLFFHTGPIQNMTLVVLNLVFSPAFFADFRFKKVVSTLVYMWTLSKTFWAFVNIISKITITITIRQT